MTAARTTMLISVLAFSSTSARGQTDEATPGNHWALALKVAEDLNEDAELNDIVLKTARTKLSTTGATVATGEQIEEARTALGMADLNVDSFVELLGGVGATHGILFEVASHGEKLVLTVHKYDSQLDILVSTAVKPAPRASLKRNVRKKVAELTKPVKGKKKAKNKDVTPEIMKIGVALSSLDSDTAKTLGLKRPNGAHLTGISEAGVAQHSGLAVDDVIVKVGKKKARTSIDAAGLLGQARSGDVLSLEIWRAGEKSVVEMSVAPPAAAEEESASGDSGDDAPTDTVEPAATAESESENATDAAQTEAPKPPPSRKLGVRVRAVTPKIAASLGLGAPTGALVVSVKPGSIGEKSQLRPNDIILTINDQSVTHARELTPSVDATYPRQRLRMEVWRNKAPTTVNVEFPEGPTASAESTPTP